MKKLKAFSLGLLGGLIGAGIWVLVSYELNFEFSWIAFGIGILVGGGFLIGHYEWTGRSPAFSAVFIAIASIFTAKVTTIILWDYDEAIVFKLNVSDEEIILNIAYNNCLELEKQGQSIPWPESRMTAKRADHRLDYPDEIWSEATEEWKQLSKAQQDAIRKKEEQRRLAYRDIKVKRLRKTGIERYFEYHDILWYSTASIVAFVIAAGIFPQRKFIMNRYRI